MMMCTIHSCCVYLASFDISASSTTLHSTGSCPDILSSRIKEKTKSCKILMYAKSVMESFWSPVNNAKEPFSLSYKKATKKLQLQIVKGHFSSQKIALIQFLLVFLCKILWYILTKIWIVRSIFQVTWPTQFHVKGGDIWNWIWILRQRRTGSLFRGMGIMWHLS